MSFRFASKFKKKNELTHFPLETCFNWRKKKSNGSIQKFHLQRHHCYDFFCNIFLHSSVFLWVSKKKRGIVYWSSFKSGNKQVIGVSFSFEGNRKKQLLRSNFVVTKYEWFISLRRILVLLRFASHSVGQLDIIINRSNSSQSAIKTHNQWNPPNQYSNSVSFYFSCCKLFAFIYF